MPSSVVVFGTLRSVAFGSITGSYTALGSPFAHPVRIIRIINNTNTDVFISLDGTNNNMYLPAGTFVLYDFTTNRELISPYFVIPNGTQLYIKYNTSPASGSVFVETIYGYGE